MVKDIKKNQDLVHLQSIQMIIMMIITQGMSTHIEVSFTRDGKDIFKSSLFKMQTLFSDYDYFPVKDRIYYPDIPEMPAKRQMRHSKAAYKVLKKRRTSKMVDFSLDSNELNEVGDSENSKILDRIPELLTPFLRHDNYFGGGGLVGNSGGGNGGFYNDYGTCRRDYDCAGNQKCCHVQVAKYRFRLGCRYPRMNYY